MSQELSAMELFFLQRFEKSLGGTRVEASEIRNLALEERCIDLTTTTGLNLRDDCSHIRDLLFSTENSSTIVVSDVDEQLIFKVFFREPVSIYSILIRANNKPTNNELDTSRPKNIHIYANRPEFDFSESDSVKPDQNVLMDDDVTFVKLKGTKFTHVKSLSIFVAENCGDTMQTFVNQITLFGYVHPNYKSGF